MSTLAAIARLEYTALPGQSWHQIEALPEPQRRAVQRVIFHLLTERVPALADPFPVGDPDPLPGAYQLRLPADGVAIWYTRHTTAATRSSASNRYAR